MKTNYFIIIPFSIFFIGFIVSALGMMWDDAIRCWKFGSKTEVILATILTLSFISVAYGSFIFFYA